MLHVFNEPYRNAEDPESYATPKVRPPHIWWSKRKDIVTLRKSLLRQWLFASIELWMVIFLISAIYLGSGHNPNKYTSNLEVAIVDFDGDLAGTILINAFRQTPSGNLTLGWRYKYPDDFNNNIDDAKRYVENGNAWAIVILLPNTTRLINESLFALLNTTSSITSPFVYTSPVLIAYESGRNSYTIANFVLPPILTAVAKASARYGQILRNQLINNLSSTSGSFVNRSSQLVNTAQLGSLLANPLTEQSLNLHPALPFVGTLATTLGYIYLYLISGIVVGSSIKYVAPLVGKIHWSNLLVYRILNGFFQAFMVSLIYSLIVLWFFGIHSGGLFMRYWMFNWLSCLIFGMVVVIFTTNLGIIANSLLIVFVVLMLAGATIQITLELSPSFFRYGYGLPLYHIMNGGRHLLFNSYSDFGLDVGILIIYFVVFWMLGITTSVLRLYLQQRKALKAAEKVKTKKKRFYIATIARH